MRKHKINRLNNFIAGWYFDDLSLCDDIISFFKKSPNKRKGVFLAGVNEYNVNQEVKNSTDLHLTDDKLILKYMDALQKVTNEYKKKYIYCDLSMHRWGFREFPNIQHYEPPNGGYHHWHTERGGSENSMDRHLVYMTYLNDVSDAGETEWYYQKLKIKPEKGLTLIWPVDWTFMHRGIRSPTQEKYIITGWFHFEK